MSVFLRVSGVSYMCTRSDWNVKDVELRSTDRLTDYRVDDRPRESLQLRTNYSSALSLSYADRNKLTGWRYKRMMLYPVTISPSGMETCALSTICR